MIKGVCESCSQKDWLDDGLCERCLIKFGIEEELENLTSQKVGEKEIEKDE